MTAGGDSSHFSLVVPAFNEEERIAQSLSHIGEYLKQLPYETELIVVDDGSAEAGRKALRGALDELPPEVEHRLLRHDTNQGKGAAVRTGCLAAHGDFVAFIDADLATPPEELPGLIDALEHGADVAIGVRRQADGSDMRNRRRFARRLAGQAFAAFMRLLLLPNIADSQCPLKAFTRDAAQRLFVRQHIDTWAFDAELLYVSRRLGLRVAQVPVRWRAVAGSHLHLNLRTARELWNLLRIRWLHRDLAADTL